MARFRLFGLPINVHFSFLILALFAPGRVWTEVVAWMGAVFLAVLAHELGHALVARRFGAGVSVTLLAFGGYTAWSMEEPASPSQRLAISAAGSAVGIILGGLVFVAARLDLIPGLGNDVFAAFVVGFWWASFVWGILNWLPIPRLDGGHMLTAFLEIVWPTRAIAVARIITVAVGVAAMAVAAYLGYYIAALFVGLMVLSELRAGGASSLLEPSKSQDSPEENPARLQRPEFPI